jgi:tripartite-type tricarboxylate transporter receptor subunit TctC
MIQTLSRRALSTTALAALAVAVLGGPAAAQDAYPAREIKIICGYAAGTGADTIVRIFADRLRPLTDGKPVIVENRAGALTQIAAEVVKNARPDGYTLFITAGNSTMSSNPHLFKQIKYDPLKDFAPVTTLIKLPFMVVVPPNSPMKSMKDLETLLKSKGDKGTYGYPNTFSLAASLAATELYKQKLGLATQGVPYNSTPQSVIELAKGDLDFVISDATFLLNQSKQGLVKPLAVTTAKRSTLAPDIPSMEDSGIKDYDLSAWWAAFFPAGTPQPIVDKMAGWLNQIVPTDDTRAALNNVGAEPWLGSTKVLADHMVADLKLWGEIIKLAKIEPQ